MAALVDATLVFVAVVVGVAGVAGVDEVDGTNFTVGTTEPVGALDGLVALGDCELEVGADETVPVWPTVGAAPIEVELGDCAALAPTTAPVAVAGVKPGKLAGKGCIGEVSTVNPGGIVEAVVVA